MRIETLVVFMSSFCFFVLSIILFLIRYNDLVAFIFLVSSGLIFNLAYNMYNCDEILRYNLQGGKK